MKKIIIVFLSFFIWINISNSAWYGTHLVWHGAGGITECDSDLDITGGAGGVNSKDTQVISWDGGQSGNMTCQKWDRSFPIISLSDTNTTRRRPFNLTLNTSDLGGSLLNSAKYSWNSVPNCDGSAGNFSNGTIISTPGGSNTLYLCARDNAGNITTKSQVYNIDNVPPVITPSISSKNRTNSNITVSLSCTDPQRTSCTKLQYTWSTSISTPGSYTTVIGTNPIANTTLSSEGVWYLHVRGEDASLPNVYTNYFGPYKLDKTAPIAADINNSAGTSLLANNNYTYNLSITNGGLSPITVVSGLKENKDTQAISDPFSGLSFSWDISKVDNARLTNGSRDYSLNVTHVCDEAGNCWNGTKPFNHNVYANTNLMTGGSSKKDVTTNDLYNTSNVADGTNKYLTITLKDFYGNEVVPAPGISRTIDFNFNYSNSLYLNQYNQSGNSAVYTDYCSSILSISGHEFSIGNTIKFCNGENGAGDGTYTYGFQVYTPTQNTYSKAHGNFNMNSITYDVNQNLALLPSGAVSSQGINNSNFAFNFNPLYYTTFAGAQKSGFIEGVSQNGSLAISKNISTANPSISTYLKFGGNMRDYDMYYSKTGSATTLISESNLSTNYGNTNGGLITKLIQTSSKANTTSDVYLSSHIGYTLNSKDVVYNSDIIGKNNYFDSTYLTQEQANQSQLKVYGLVGTTSSTKLNSFTSNQAGNVMEVSGGFDKATFKSELISGVTRLVNSKNGNTIDATANLITDLTTISKQGGDIVGDNKNIILYKTNKLVSLYNGDYDSTPIGISDKKTIVIYGGDLYINRDMYYTNNSSILGIIVMKDSSGKGGNIYISPKVTNVVGSIFASKAVFSATVLNLSKTVDDLASGNGITYYDGNADANVLKNQLYIYGNLFSANTLGGSKSNPKKCPYYVASCTADESIKYDLNFLRRYYLVDNVTKNPYQTGKIIGGYTCSGGYCNIGGNANLTKLFDYTTNINASYPLIIKYNSTLQTNPPPLFSRN